MSKRKPQTPNIAWVCRRVGAHPNAQVMVKKPGEVEIAYFPTTDGYAFNMPRSLARLLARRINQALKETRP